MDSEAIKKFLDSGAGKALKGYLLAKLNELGSIDSIKEKDVATHQTIEVKAQKRAYAKLKEIYSEIMTMGEDKKERDERDSYAVE